MQSLAHKFLEFCRSKPADEKYDYVDNNGCAFAQFLIAAGYSSHPRVAFSWDDDEGREHPLPYRLNDALSHVDSRLPNYGRTFGALATRLEAALTEQVS